MSCPDLGEHSGRVKPRHRAMHMQKVRRRHPTAQAETQEISGVTMEWYKKAIQVANRIDPAHTSPWKLASTYALLSIAESLGSGRPTHSAPKPSGELRCANEQCAMYREPGTPVINGDYDILTL